MPVYERLEPGARTPWDAVVVTVRRGWGRTLADIAAVEHIADFPMPVPAALGEAAALRDKLGLTRIVVMLMEEQLWRPEWGRLCEKAELDAERQASLNDGDARLGSGLT